MVMDASAILVRSRSATFTLLRYTRARNCDALDVVGLSSRVRRSLTRATAGRSRDPRMVAHLAQALPAARARRGWLARALAFATLSLLCSGCIAVDLALAVRTDGSAFVSNLVAVDAAILDAFPDLADLIKPNPARGVEVAPGLPIDAALLTGVSHTPYDEAGWRGWLLEGEIAPGSSPPADLSAAASEVFGAVLEGVVLRPEGDGWRFAATLPPSSAPVGALPDGLAAAGDGARNSSFTLRVRLPGHPGEHNADRIVSDVFIWDLALSGQEQPRPLFASTGAAQSGGVSPIAWIGGIILLLSLVGLGGWWWHMSHLPPAPPAASGPPAASAPNGDWARRWARWRRPRLN